jgi:hypothetical protein
MSRGQVLLVTSLKGFRITADGRDMLRDIYGLPCTAEVQDWTCEHRLLSSGDCSCGWKASALLSYDQAVGAWQDHPRTQSMDCLRRKDLDDKDFCLNCKDLQAIVASIEDENQ